MRIDDIQIGEEYVGQYGTTRYRAEGIETVQRTTGHRFDRRTRSERRVRLQPLDHDGVALGPPVLWPARDIDRTWAEADVEWRANEAAELRRRVAQGLLRERFTRVIGEHPPPNGTRDEPIEVNKFATKVTLRGTALQEVLDLLDAEAARIDGGDDVDSWKNQ